MPSRFRVMAGSSRRASRDGRSRVWDEASGGLRTEFNSHHDKIYAIEFSSTGDLMLSAGA